MLNILLLITNVFLMASGQILFKLGARSNEIRDFSNLLIILTNGYVLAAVAVYGFSTMLWLYVLTRLNLSLAYPTQSLSFVLVMIAAVFIFKEPVSVKQWVGVTLIMAGVVFVAQGK